MKTVDAFSPQDVGYDVALLRRTEFPWCHRAVYLDHASTGPLPESTRLEVEAFNEERAAAPRLKGERLFGILDAARAAAADFIGAEAREIALTTNTSYGLNLAALALPLVPGDIVLVSRDEFPANVYPWRNLAAKGITTELVPVTDEGWPDEARIAERMADPRVKVLAISLVQFHNGYLADVASLSRRARETDTFLVVDAIQGIGQVPFDTRQTHVDILACGAQKWLLSPWGSGFLYVHRDLVPRLDPPWIGWTAFLTSDDFGRLTDYPTTLREDARRFEMLTLPYQDLLGMTKSLEMLKRLGLPNIQRHLAAIGRPVIEWARQQGIRLTSPTGPNRSAIIGLALSDPERARRTLAEAEVVASVREGALRLSPHCYNTIDDMVRVVDVLDQLVRKRP